MNGMLGIYDSGLGGLSVLRAVQDRLPQYRVAYLADSAYCPYGPRPMAEVRERSLACAGYLVAQGAQIVIVACNTASAAALELLRSTLPVPIVGMEPGVKPAIAATRTRRVGVLATGGTLMSNRYTLLVQRFAGNVEVFPVACPKLVEQVEAGELDTPRTRALVAGYLDPLLTNNIDTVVLGCTHFHFLAPLIAELAGPDVTIIDTAPAVARQVEHVASIAGMVPGANSAPLHIITTGNPAAIAPVVARVWGGVLPVEHANC
jgi:glutamate racemase